MRLFIQQAFFYARLSVLFAFKLLFVLTGLVSRRARIGLERLSLPVLNRLFSAPTPVQAITSVEDYDRFQDPSEFFTLCKRVGISPAWFRGKTVLDVGCGTGKLTQAVSDSGAAGVTGIDIDSSQIEFARRGRASEQRNTDFRTASVYELPFPDESFDEAYSLTVFEHLADPSKALLETSRVLKPAGRFIVIFNAYRSRYGAHLGPFVHIPWPAFFFTQDVLVEFWQARHGKFCKAEHVKPDVYLRPQTFLELNRLTVREFESIIASTGFQIDAQSSYSEENLPLRVMPALRRYPALYEYLRGSCVFLLRKGSVSQPHARP